MEVKSTFLNGYFNGEVCVEQTKGFIDPCSPYHMYKLKKKLYGLKQSLRAWYEIFTEFLTINWHVRGGIKKTMFVNK